METIAGITAILAIKLTAIIIGYKIVALGHDTLVRGLKGEFEFSGSDGGRGLKLKSSSPGLLFVLLGSLLVGWAVFVEKPIEYSWIEETTTHGQQKQAPEKMKVEK